MTACVKVLGHPGRCRDMYGTTWDNNHAPLLQAVPVDAIRTLVALHRDRDEWSPADHDTADECCAVLAPLVGVKP